MTPNSQSREELLARFRSEFGLEDLAGEDLDLALTHSSHANEKGLRADNERLEFLGDAVLSAIISEYLYNEHPEEREGELSKRRAHLVSRSMLGKRAAEMGLGPILLLGIGEGKTGGGRRRSVLGSALEALLGIIYLRGGYESARQFVHRNLLGGLFNLSGQDAQRGDYKSALQEWSQRTHGSLPVYRLIEESGPDHDKKFTVEVQISGQPMGTGMGSRIKIAENEAARKALDKLAVPGH